jgi:hypothetical protein
MSLFLLSDSSLQSRPRFSQNPVFRAAPPEVSKPSQHHSRRTMLVSPDRTSFWNQTKGTELRASVPSMMVREAGVNESESHSSLALSGSDEDEEKKKATVPKSRPNKVRPTFMGQEFPKGSGAGQSRSTLLKARHKTSGSSSFPPSPTMSKDSFESSVPVISHKEQLISLMSKFRGLEES